MATFDKIKSLLKQLLPTGRAFRLAPNGTGGDKFIESNSESISRAHNDVISLLNSILPDNANFTADDATDWEVRLGMIVSPLVDLELRKAAIIRKMNHPGTIQARQSADYFQSQLHLAGFTGVFVHANNGYLSIESILGLNELVAISGRTRSGMSRSGNVFSLFSEYFYTVRSGTTRSGLRRSAEKYYMDKIANHIDSSLDLNFVVGNNKRTFVIGGEIFGEFGEIPTERISEFRQLVLKLKPINSVAYLLINYT